MVIYMDIVRRTDGVEAPNRTKDIPEPNEIASSEKLVDTDLSLKEKVVVEPSEIDKEELKSAVETLNSFMTALTNNSLLITVDETTSKVLLRVINKETDEIIKQIPSEEAINLIKRLEELSQEYFGDSKGLIVEKTV